MKKIGIITFHNSYNCGSMLESYAIQKYLQKQKLENEIIDFSNNGQKEIYSILFKNSSIKNIIKNILLFPWKNRIKLNNSHYEQFKNKNFELSDKKYSENNEIEDNYSIVIAGSDQIWNITIADSDDAYFLPWVTQAKKVAYAPSFGAKNILKYSNNPEKYKKYISSFDALSVREKNGKKWIKNLTGKDAELLIDPTLLLSQDDYDKIEDNSCTPKGDYIFFYSPSFDSEICNFISKISRKYDLPVITWSTKSYAVKGIYRYGFRLPKYESPAVYLSLIKNAKLVFTTSFHGTIFSTIYKKNFYTIKNGGMYGDDDRVKTLLESIKLEERLIPYDFDSNYDYLKNVNYDNYSRELSKLQANAERYINKNIGDVYFEINK